MPLLNPGQPFPSITLAPVDGEPLDLPDVLAGQFAVVVLSRLMVPLRQRPATGV